MANSFYTGFLTKLLGSFLGSETAPATPTVKVVPVNSTYVYAPGHRFTSDLVGVLAVAQPLSGVTYVGGILKADNLVDIWAASGEVTINALILYTEDAGGATTLMAYIDTGFSASLPLITGNHKVNITWDAAGIFGV